MSKQSDAAADRRRWSDSQGHRDRRDDHRRETGRITVPSERTDRRGR